MDHAVGAAYDCIYCEVHNSFRLIGGLQIPDILSVISWNLRVKKVPLTCYLGQRIEISTAQMHLKLN